jgi:hypothetical protein
MRGRQKQITMTAANADLLAMSTVLAGERSDIGLETHATPAATDSPQAMHRLTGMVLPHSNTPTANATQAGMVAIATPIKGIVNTDGPWADCPARTAAYSNPPMHK